MTVEAVQGKCLTAAILAESMRTKLLEKGASDKEWQSLLFGTCDSASVSRVPGLPSPVLVTGAGGLLGGALVQTLRLQGYDVVGLDIRESPTTSVVGSITDAAAVRQAMTGCKVVLHTAALHAPDADRFSEDDFTHVNVFGTETILNCAEGLGLPVVHTSTTSLMITDAVKAKIAEGPSTVWLDEHPTGPPRNKYGRSKLCAEERFLRAPRFFLEEDVNESAILGPNQRVNELLGRRCALEDLVEAHLLAAAKVASVDKRVFILTPPSPCPKETAVTSEHIREAVPNAQSAFDAVNWQLPTFVDRIYDGSAAREALDWQPKWTFEYVVERLLANDARALSAAF
eukprot:TRINITY_DN13825_c0_g1_i3.p1 TRINITY_DN13825_c0_g1~~TRINITY_DN13825_c0_g1_i3.p1  ORF type:complete len:343 (-),score=47.06 TRINITY_DN13825_c0_g1_i3:360-1388(-)